MRDIPPAVQSLLGTSPQYMAFFMELERSGAPLRIWTGVGQKAWQGGTYEGVGELIGVSRVEETTELAAPSLSFTLSGIPPEHVQTALSEQLRGNLAKLWWVWFTDETFATIAGGFEVHRGFADVSRIREDGESAVYSLTVESRLVEMQSSSGRVWTEQDQRQLRDSSDGFFDHVAAIQELDLGQWGA